jgi:hypothetical protein
VPSSVASLPLVSIVPPPAFKVIARLVLNGKRKRGRIC